MPSVKNSDDPQAIQDQIAALVKPPKATAPDPKDRRQIDRAAELKRQEAEAKARS